MLTKQGEQYKVIDKRARQTLSVLLAGCKPRRKKSCGERRQGRAKSRRKMILQRVVLSFYSNPFVYNVALLRNYIRTSCKPSRAPEADINLLLRQSICYLIKLKRVSNPSSMPDHTDHADDLYPELSAVDPPPDQSAPQYGDGNTTFFESLSDGEERRIAEQDAHNALEQLFNPDGRHAGAVVDGDGGVEGDLQLDPTLASEMEAQQHAHHDTPTHVQLDQGASASGSSTRKQPRPHTTQSQYPDPESESGDRSATGTPAGKRKATSRAGMLARGAACDFCKRRKLKCSAETPSCATCLRSGRDCVYSQTKQRSKVKMLEERLAELERKLDQQELERKLERRRSESPRPNASASSRTGASSEMRLGSGNGDASTSTLHDEEGYLGAGDTILDERTRFQ